MNQLSPTTFQPIQQAQTLPVPARASETQTLDFKRRMSLAAGKPKHTELAKDLAAMANAVGGTILIGAEEKDEVLTRYVVLSDKDARMTIDAFDAAAGKFCSPSPVIVTARIPHDKGFVVSVNVLPHPGNLMGVRIPVKKDAAYSAGDAYRFPVRVGTQTIEVEPAVFPIPEGRKVMLALAQIPAGAQVKLCYRNDNPGGRVEKVHVFRKVNLLDGNFETATPRTTRTTPIDDVRVVVPPPRGNLQNPIPPQWTIRMLPEARW